LGFLHGSNMIFQLLLSNKREAVPVDRNYIINAERAMLATENGVSKKPKKTGKAKRTAAPRPKKKK
jgi:hypothetical protein